MSGGYMFGRTEDGYTKYDLIVLFVVFVLIVLCAIPHYKKLTNTVHNTKIEVVYNSLRTSINYAKIDSLAASGFGSVPQPSELILYDQDNWYDSKNWLYENSGKWTYLPTGTKIVYNRLKRDTYTLDIIIKN